MHPEQMNTLEHLAEVSRHLDEAVNEYAELEHKANEYGVEYERAYARTFLALDGSMELRKQQTLLDTWEAKLDKETAESKVKVCKERIRTLHAQLEVLRSINAAQRSQFTAEPIGQFT